VRVAVGHHGPAGHQVHGELVGDCGMREVGHALLGEQRGNEVAVLFGLGGGQRGQHASGQTEVEPDPEDMAAPDAPSGEDQQPMLRQHRPQLRHDWHDRVGALVHD